MSIWNWIIRQAKKKYSRRARITAMPFEGLFFVIVIPALLVYLSFTENGEVSIIKCPAFLIIGAVVALCGISFAFWTVWVQFHQAHGTPVPIMATQKLLTNRPYSFCRNPMVLGTIIFYAGISVILRSYLSIVATILFLLFLIVWIKIFEEKEMTLRFGQDYLRYKQETPFLIPRVRWTRKQDG